MILNNLVGVSGSINSGKDLVGEMLIYIDHADNPTYKGFESEVILDSPYKIKKCADKLKEVVALIIGCKRSDLEDEEFKNRELGEEWWRYQHDNEILSKAEFEKLPPYTHGWWTLVKITPRMMLQEFGTQGGRMVVHPNIWVNALFADYIPKIPYLATSTYDNLESKWIITDVRFPDNEGVAVTKRGGLLIGVKRKFALKQPNYAYLIDGGRDEYKVPYELEGLNYKLYKSLMHESETAMGDYSWCDVVIENNGTKEELFNNVLNAVNIKLEKV